jgi:hypothetical protein
LGGRGGKGKGGGGGKGGRREGRGGEGGFYVLVCSRFYVLVYSTRGGLVLIRFSRAMAQNPVFPWYGAARKK